MASAIRRSPRDLIQELEEDAPHFGFFQAVRLLSLTALNYGGRRRGKLPERLRFRTVPSLSFPASELTQYRPAEADKEDDELSVAFMGLVGPSGVLPTPYTELICERRLLYRDTGLHAFLDIFSHRAISLFYGAWRKYRYWLDVEEGEQDTLTRNLFDIVGVGFKSLRDRLGSHKTNHLDKNLFAFYAGLLSQKPISAQAMSAVIQGFFGLRAELVQFVGQWIDVPEDEQTRPGLSACELGLSAFSGDRMWDRQTKVELCLGPMRREQFEQLLPGETGAQALESLVRFMVGYSLACDVRLILDRRDIPEPNLGQHLRLGSTWLLEQPPEQDPSEMCYRLLQ